MNYKILDMEKYYRKGVFRHFSQDCKCSTSMTYKLDVTELVKLSKENGTKFYINFLYCLGKVINSRDDYKMAYFWEKEQVVVFDKMNITHYVFHDDTETCTPVYTEFDDDYRVFYENCSRDIEFAKGSREYMLDSKNHVNYFDASFVSWISYDSLNVELPDGYLYLQPIINWGKYQNDNGRLLMPVSVRLNHAIADGYLLSKVFLLLEKIMGEFVGKNG